MLRSIRTGQKTEVCKTSKIPENSTDSNSRYLKFDIVNDWSFISMESLKLAKAGTFYAKKT